MARTKGSTNKKKVENIVSITKEIKKFHKAQGIKLSKQELNNLVMLRMSTDKVSDNSQEIGIVNKNDVHKYSYKKFETKDAIGKITIVETDF